eukprot:1666775-Rhodomonas_salina.2
MSSPSPYGQVICNVCKPSNRRVCSRSWKGKADSTCDTSSGQSVCLGLSCLGGHAPAVCGSWLSVGTPPSRVRGPRAHAGFGAPT